jgi:replicative DNA helicase
MSDNDWPTVHNEEALCLSALMRAGDSYRKAAEKDLKVEMFDRYKDLARVVLSVEGRPDADTVRSRYGGDKLDEVLDLSPPPRNVTEYVPEIREAYGWRCLLNVIYTYATEAGEMPFQEAAAELEEELVGVTTEMDTGGSRHMSDLVPEVLRDLEDEQGQVVTGIPSGFPKLDRLTKGWQDGDLIIPFGSTSMGKTAFSLCCALNAAREGYGVAIHSLEMPAKQLTRRLIQMEARVDVRQTTIPEAEFERITQASAKLADLPLWIDEATALDPLTHRSRLRHLDHEHGIDLAVVDYLQQMRTASTTTRKHDEVHAVAEGLKDTAKLMGIPVICPSQTTRGPDNRSDKRPGLSDLREAGEEPADTAIGLYRPEYYNISVDEQGNQTDGMAEAIVAKQRNGEVGSVDLAFVKEHAAFEPLDKREAAPRGDGAPTKDDAPF